MAKNEAIFMGSDPPYPHSFNLTTSGDNTKNNTDTDTDVVNCSSCSLQQPSSSCDATCEDACFICNAAQQPPPESCTKNCILLCDNDCNQENICSDSDCDALMNLPDLNFNWEGWACFDPSCAQADDMLLDCCSTSHDDLFPQALNPCWNTSGGVGVGIGESAEMLSSLPSLHLSASGSLSSPPNPLDNGTITPRNATSVEQLTMAQLDNALLPSSSSTNTHLVTAPASSRTRHPSATVNPGSLCNFVSGDYPLSSQGGTICQCKWTNCNQIFMNVHELSHHVHSKHIPLPSMASFDPSFSTADAAGSTTNTSTLSALYHREHPCEEIVNWTRPNAPFPYPVSAQRHPVDEKHSSTHAEHHHHLSDPPAAATSHHHHAPLYSSSCHFRSRPHSRPPQLHHPLIPSPPLMPSPPFSYTSPEVPSTPSLSSVDGDLEAKYSSEISLLPTLPSSHDQSESHSSRSPHSQLPPESRQSESDPQTQQQQQQHQHICRWKDCSEAFPSPLLLTEHLTSVHVGSGKNVYECFWGGCDRNNSGSAPYSTSLGDEGGGEGGEGGKGEKKVSGRQGGSGGSGGALSSKQKILRHLQTHTGYRPFRCERCGQCFSEAATLQQHKRRHTNERPFVCDEPGCGKSFAIAGALTIHKRTHNGHKPFKCTHCGKCFTESSNLAKHIRTHTGDRPYVCSEERCGKRFARPDQLARHGAVHRKAIAVSPCLPSAMASPPPESDLCTKL
ncbi:uncharacterized protein EI90DRAFT_3074954 [Cantharellus anzutake]|uniref:uncharacterized protein n=1 Tax=Cantharellus anzutake TaxID=1750568 RepID=UPI0019044EE2|nr:uncharacterized protein EI90DRAFT_3074954 [Cantharellus anzutake]KAF8324529.1 hypothetical protein EI90DRAFT_3074954 [Cantharellus anzutake]